LLVDRSIRSSRLKKPFIFLILIEFERINQELLLRQALACSVPTRFRACGRSKSPFRVEEDNA
jgi:hypothetical protein